MYFSLRDKKPVISGNAARKLAFYEEFCEVKLLRVQGVFDLARAPLLQPSLDEPFRNFSSVMTVQLPDRPEFEISASFELTHFNIPNMTAPVEQRWQIVTGLGKISKDAVPKGNLIFCVSEVRARFAALD